MNCRLVTVTTCLVLVAVASAVQVALNRPARFDLGYIQVTTAARQEAQSEVSKNVFSKLRDALAVSGAQESGWLFLTSESGVPILIDLREGMVADAIQRRELWRDLDRGVGDDGLLRLGDLTPASAAFLLNYLGFGASTALPVNRGATVMLTCEAYLTDARTGRNLGGQISKQLSGEEFQRRTGAMASSPVEITEQARLVTEHKIDFAFHPKQSVSLRACMIRDELDQLESLESASRAIFEFLKPLIEEQAKLQARVMARIGADIEGVDETRDYSFSELPEDMRSNLAFSGSDEPLQNNPRAKFRIRKSVMLNVIFRNNGETSFIAVAIKH